MLPKLLLQIKLLAFTFSENFHTKLKIQLKETIYSIDLQHLFVAQIFSMIIEGNLKQFIHQSMNKKLHFRNLPLVQFSNNYIFYLFYLFIFNEKNYEWCCSFVNHIVFISCVFLAFSFPLMSFKLNLFRFFRVKFFQTTQHNFLRSYSLSKHGNFYLFFFQFIARKSTKYKKIKKG